MYNKKVKVMSTKEYHILNFWYAKLVELENQLGRAVSGGELARYVGQSGNTAKRYLKKLCFQNVIDCFEHTFPNGVKGMTYQVKTE